MRLVQAAMSGVQIMKLKKFEYEVLKILLGFSEIITLFKDESKDYGAIYEFTGVGYFITIKDPLLPASRTVYDEPIIIGKTKDVEDVSFVLFVENNELVFECFSYVGTIPSDIRNRNIVLEIQNPKYIN